MLSSKRASFFSNLLSNSQADDFNDAAREWKMSKIGHSEQFSPCECCGTAMKRHAIIENEVTGATLIIGLNCLENLRCTQEGLELPSLKEYVAAGKAILKGKIKQFYEEDTPVVFRNWRNWFLSLENIPDDLKEGVAQLRYWGILSDEFVDRFIKYHDDNRLFPREVLISDDIYHYLEVKLAIPIPAFLTINQARGYLEYRAKKECLEKGMQKLKQLLGRLIKVKLTYLKRKKGKLFRIIKTHGYKTCPKCFMICEPAHFPNHLVQEHGYQICPVCNEIVAKNKIRIHLAIQHHYKDCPVCNEICSNINTHLREKHDSQFCPHCGIVIKLNEFDNHLQQKHNYKRCPVCNRPVSDLQSHLYQEHGYVKCSVCAKLISGIISDLHTHLVEEHNYKRCPVCNRICKSIYKHLEEKHDYLICSICKNVFKKRELGNYSDQPYNYLEWRCPGCSTRKLQKKKRPKNLI